MMRRFWIYFLGCILAATGYAQEKPKLSPLAIEPDWHQLDAFQGKITRAEFQERLEKIYSFDGGFKPFFEINNQECTVYRDKQHQFPLWKVRFRGPNDVPFSAVRTHLQTPLPDKPLSGLTICLDPGHIGGEWSRMEERFFVLKKDRPIREAELNLWTCQRLAPLLEQAGAQVVWTKTSLKPVTSRRPLDLRKEASALLLEKRPELAKHLSNPRIQQEIDRQSKFLFYRIAEIQARATKIDQLKPDLTLCVHYNADEWGNPDRPTLLDKNRLVIFAHGCYLARELEYDDQKFYLLKKLFANNSSFEVSLAESIANEMKIQWGWLPEDYKSGRIARRTQENSYVWYRNLMASRIFNSPVVFIEGPYMNDRNVYKRLAMGDYEGQRMVDGVMRESIFREFAEIIAGGLTRFYSTRTSTLASAQSEHF